MLNEKFKQWHKEKSWRGVSIAENLLSQALQEAKFHAIKHKDGEMQLVAPSNIEDKTLNTPY